jgi:hypothetical protein
VLGWSSCLLVAHDAWSCACTAASCAACRCKEIRDCETRFRAHCLPVEKVCLAQLRPDQVEYGTSSLDMPLLVATGHSYLNNVWFPFSRHVCVRRNGQTSQVHFESDVVNSPNALYVC